MGNKKKAVVPAKKETAPTKWYLNKKVLWVTAPILFVTGIALILYSTMDNNMVGLYIGIALIPMTGLLITPKIIVSALEECRTWKDRIFMERGKSFKKSILKEEVFSEVEDPSAYHERINAAVRSNARKNFIVLAVVVIAVILGGLYQLANGIDFDSHAYRDVVTPRQETEAYTELVFIVFGLIILLFPIFAYNITCSVCRIRTVRNREYYVCRAVVKEVENSEILIWGKSSYKFKFCTCLGIREKDVNNTRAILVFVPDEVYLIPDDDAPKDELNEFKDNVDDDIGYDDDEDYRYYDDEYDD